jgi:hypothetical protein
MRIHIIACRVFNRELSYYAALSPHTVDVTWLPQGLHDTPDALRRMLSEAIDQIHRQIDQDLLKHRPDYIALGYGLCSNGVVGLAPRDIPLVIPRTDDCIALFLGSQSRYLRLFEYMNGTYWLNNGWIETSGSLVAQRETREQRRQMYAEKYGEDNADFLVEQEGAWVSNYNTCAFIHSDVYESPAFLEAAVRAAEENSWKFEEVRGDMRMIKALCNGEWNEEEYLIVRPGQRVAADYSGKKIRTEANV